MCVEDGQALLWVYQIARSCWLRDKANESRLPRFGHVTGEIVEILEILRQGCWGWSCQAGGKEEKYNMIYLIFISHGRLLTIGQLFPVMWQLPNRQGKDYHMLMNLTDHIFLNSCLCSLRDCHNTLSCFLCFYYTDLKCNLPSCGSMSLQVLTIA